MTKQAADIFSDFERIRERMEQAWRQVLGPPGAPRFGSPLIEPPVDVYETDSHVVVLVEIPGISEEEVEVVIDGRMLVISGERKASAAEPKRLYSQMEICNGPFRRELLLPSEVNPDAALAEYCQGLLEIVLPKVTSRVSRHVRLVVR